MYEDEGVLQEKTKVLCHASDPKKLTVFEQLIFIIKFHREVKNFLDEYEGDFECPKPNQMFSLLTNPFTTSTSNKLKEIYEKIDKLHGSLYTKINDECDIKKTIMELIDNENSIQILEKFNDNLKANTIPENKDLFKKITSITHLIQAIYVKYCEDYTVPFYNDQTKFINLLEKSKCKKSPPSNPVVKKDLHETPSQSSSEPDDEQSPSTPQQGGKRRKTRQRRRRRRNVTIKRRPHQKKYHRR